MYAAAKSLWDHFYYKMLKLDNKDDLEVLGSIAKDRVGWEFTKRIVEAGNVMHFFKDDAEFQ